MISEVKVKKVPHPEFADRMLMACDGNADIPLPNYGRLGWFVEQLEQRFNVTVSVETIRKWFAGESYPRKKFMPLLAQLMKVDEAWLSSGLASNISEKERKIRDAAADGAVNVIAGMIQMGGGTPAFPSEGDERANKSLIDLYAIIRGAQYGIHVVTGVRTADGWDVTVPTSASEALVLALLPNDDLQYEVIELDWEKLSSEGQRRSGSYELKIPTEYEGIWKRIKTFSERL